MTGVQTCALPILELSPIGSLIRPQSLPELKAAISGILHGLEWLHGNGFVHRDLRWNNVIIDSTGCVRIIDFEHSGKEGQWIFASHMAVAKE